MRISNYYMALNMLNDLSWVIVSAQNDRVSTMALMAVDDLRDILLDAIKKDASPPLADLLREGPILEGTPPPVYHHRREGDPQEKAKEN